MYLKWVPYCIIGIGVLSKLAKNCVKQLMKHGTFVGFMSAHEELYINEVNYAYVGPQICSPFFNMEIMT